MTAYYMFKLKTMINITIHSLLVILILYANTRLIIKETKKAELARNDWIFNDEKNDT